ncbi:MAG: SDH family Clp fold serine proteinase [Candidatus Helarchaeota archaeon]
MSRQDRFKILKELEEKRESKIIVYITGDRRHLETRIGDDVIPIFQDILINSNLNRKKIELLLYSRGGDGSTSISLVSLIREYCDEFNVIIPWRAHSAATLIALGANSIIMLKSGQLSPVDVSINTPFNPSKQTPLGEQPIPINVEDLTGYINFSKIVLGIKKEKYLIDVLNFLTDFLNPLALGAVHRAREKNFKIASSLLQYHMQDKKIIKKISDIITMGLYEHSFLINRRDAINLRLPVKIPSIDIEKKIWTLFNEYYHLLELDQLYNQEKMLGEKNIEDIIFHRAIIEHIDNSGEKPKLSTYSFTTKRRLIRIEIEDPNLKIKLPNIIEKNLEDGWIINNSI